MSTEDLANWQSVSIHAPVKDATTSINQLRSWIKVSIHAPVKDATSEVREH